MMFQRHKASPHDHHHQHKHHYQQQLHCRSTSTVTTRKSLTILTWNKQDQHLSSYPVLLYIFGNRLCANNLFFKRRSVYILVLILHACLGRNFWLWPSSAQSTGSRGLVFKHLCSSCNYEDNRGLTWIGKTPPHHQDIQAGINNADVI